MNHEEAEAKMREAGADHGRAAASWYFDGNTETETYRRVLRGIQDGDPAVMDTLPSAPLSGEWADDPTPRSVLVDVLGWDEETTADGWNVSDEQDELLDAYEDAFHTAAQHEIERVCQSRLTPSFDLDLELGY